MPACSESAHAGILARVESWAAWHYRPRGRPGACSPPDDGRGAGDRRRGQGGARGPLGDPVEFEVKGYSLSLRKSEACNVIVEAPAEENE